MSTSHKFIAPVAVLVLVILGKALHLPALVTPLILLAYIWYVIRTQSNRAQQRTEPPASEISARLHSAIAQANFSRKAVVWVSGPGRPYIKKQGNRLLISPSMVELLSDDELFALVQEVRVVHPAAYWIEFLRTPGPWLILTGILGEVFYSSASLLLLVGCAWSMYSSASGKITEMVALRGGRAFLSQGGSMAHLLGALTKNYTALLDSTPQSRGNLARTAHKLLRVLANLAGISESDLVDIIHATGGASALLEPPARPKRWMK